MSERRKTRLVEETKCPPDRYFDEPTRICQPCNSCCYPRPTNAYCKRECRLDIVCKAVSTSHPSFILPVMVVSVLAVVVIILVVALLVYKRRKAQRGTKLLRMNPCIAIEVGQSEKLIDKKDSPVDDGISNSSRSEGGIRPEDPPCISIPDVHPGPSLTTEQAEISTSPLQSFYPTRNSLPVQESQNSPLLTEAKYSEQCTEDALAQELYAKDENETRVKTFVGGPRLASGT